MEQGLILLVVSAIVKTMVLFGMSAGLFKRWNRQSQRYITDFPLLMALTFLFYALGKIMDIYLYLRFSHTPNIWQLNDPVALLAAKIRFLISPILVIVPYFILMMVIWFEGRRRLQIFLGLGWAMLSVSAILIAQTLPQLLLINVLIAVLPISLSIITYVVIYRQKKLPEINSLLLVIGWALFIIMQLSRSSWLSMGIGTWGLSWVGELLELTPLLIIWRGFTSPASFYEEEIKPTITLNPEPKAILE
jgi:hypothetical protein